MPVERAPANSLLNTFLKERLEDLIPLDTKI